MTSINTNLSALIAQKATKSIEGDMQQAMERLSTGNRINSAADDAAGTAIVSRMDAQIRGLNQAIRNAGDGQALASTAEGAMIEIEDMLQRMRELAVQSSNGTYSESDRANLNAEALQLQTEIDRIVSTTEFNGINLLDGSADVSLQIGADAGQNMNFSIAGLGTSSLGSSGAASAGGVTASSFAGEQADTTEIQLAFNTNDSYTFDITYDAAGTLSVAAASVQNNSASAIAAAINDAAENASVDHYISASVSGNVVTVKNTQGGNLGVDAGFTSASGGTASFSTINGGTASTQSAILGAAPGSTGTTFEVDGTNAGAYVAAADATTGTAAVYEFTATSLLTAGALTTAVASGNTVEVKFGDYQISIAQGTNTDTFGNLAAAINAKQSDWTFSYDTNTETLTASAANPGAHTQGNITIEEYDNTDTLVAAGAFSGGITLDTGTNGTAGVDPVAATAASGGSHLYLDIQAADSYTMDFNDGTTTTALSFSYDGTSAGRDNVATLIGNALGSGYTVTHDQGQIHIIDEAGGDMTLSSFTSTGNGRVVASTDSNTGGNQGLSEVLDDTTYGTAAVQAAATTVAKATDVDISFTAVDTYSFSISDGNRTAVIDATAVSAITTTAGVAEMKAAIEYGLAEAGMSSSIAVTDNTDGSLTLVQSAGREISFSAFKSDQAGSMETVSGSTDTTGVAKYLDDGNAASADSVASVKLTSSSLASTAMNIIDNALDEVSNERAKLGAIMNRLDHTINSMTNVSVNTEASKGRIMDADFAAETVSLSKSQILSQAATSMLAQANQSKQTVLALLQG